MPNLYQSTQIALSLVAIITANACAAATLPSVIPRPQIIESGEGEFVWRAETQIFVEEQFLAAGNHFAQQLRQSTGFKVEVKRGANHGRQNGHLLLRTATAGASIPNEGYRLNISSNAIVIEAVDSAGMLYGIQTLLQLFPPAVYASAPTKGMVWRIPGVRIEDHPRFNWRGLLLDSSRHFFSRAEIERLLDLMVMHKLNKFHWHLTDNDGWRLEIKKYPQLTKVGAWRDDIGYGFSRKESTAYDAARRYGGYYTQEDVRAIVRYAKARNIEVVPEIDIPGHSLAALKAYPQFTCTGKAVDVFCTGKEETFRFLEDVFSEVLELFPNQYVHIGGDEVRKDYWAKCAQCQERKRREHLKDEEELQSYFVRRIGKFLNSNKRKLIGWTEIRQGGLPEGAVLMDWKGGGLEAAREGHDVIMTPGLYCYFNSHQSLDFSTHPIAIGCYISLEKAYSLEPVPAALEADKHHRILGAQASMWTEYIASQELLEHMLLPRLSALAEVVWSAPVGRNWPDFQRRLQAQYARYEEAGFNYYKARSAKIGGWMPKDLSADGVTLEWDITALVSKPDEQYLILDDTYRPSTEGLLAQPGKCHVVFDQVQGSALKISWVSLLEDQQEIARDFHAGYAGPEPRDLVARDVAYVLSLPGVKTNKKYTIRARVEPVGGTNSWGHVLMEMKTHSRGY